MVWSRRKGLDLLFSKPWSVVPVFNITCIQADEKYLSFMLEFIQRVNSRFAARRNGPPACTIQGEFPRGLLTTRPCRVAWAGSIQDIAKVHSGNNRPWRVRRKEFRNFLCFACRAFGKMCFNF